MNDSFCRLDEFEFFSSSLGDNSCVNSFFYLFSSFRFYRSSSLCWYFCNFFESINWVEEIIQVLKPFHFSNSTHDNFLSFFCENFLVSLINSFVFIGKSRCFITFIIIYHHHLFFIIIFLIYFILKWRHFSHF